MGLIKRLFGGRGEVVVTEGRIVGAPPASLCPAGKVQVEFSQGVFHTGRPQAPEGRVDWPEDPVSGLVFDDEWLLSGLKTAVNENQYRAKLEDLILTDDVSPEFREAVSEHTTLHIAPLRSTHSQTGQSPSLGYS